MLDRYKWNPWPTKKYYISWTKWTISKGGGLLEDTLLLRARYYAPYSGIYRFTFSGTSDDSAGFIKINVRRNGETVFQISDENKDEWCNSIAATWMWKMEKGQYLDFQLLDGQNLYVSEEFPLTITGELIGFLPDE